MPPKKLPQTEWERDYDGGYSAKVHITGARYPKAVTIWPENKQRWFAATVGQLRTVIGPFPNMTTARRKAEQLVRGELT